MAKEDDAAAEKQEYTIFTIHDTTFHFFSPPLPLSLHTIFILAIRGLAFDDDSCRFG